MKKHAIIPVFIPHKGCPNDCVFCNQRRITARTAPVETKDVKNIIENHLPTLQGRGLETIELAFYGGSFTGIPIEQQEEYLAAALPYKQRGDIDMIRLSTRPDYISRDILNLLKKYRVDTVELGVQSFDPQVLALSKRGHAPEDVYKACHLIKEYSFQLGIQLMIGLPGDTLQKACASARKAAEICPAIARLYPTVVLEDTALARMYAEGEYTPLTESEAVTITKEMYKILMEAGVNIIRVGLKSTDLITTSSDLSGGYHPAFRQLVEGQLARESLEKQLRQQLPQKSFVFYSNSRCFSAMIGNKKRNKLYFTEKYPDIRISYKADPSLPDYSYLSKAVT